MKTYFYFTNLVECMQFYHSCNVHAIQIDTARMCFGTQTRQHSLSVKLLIVPTFGMCYNRSVSSPGAVDQMWVRPKF